MKIPIERIVAFFGPYITVISAAIATWLVAKVNVLGLPGLDQHNTATWIAAAITFAITAGLHALGGWAWLKGRHIELQGDSGVRIQEAAAAATKQHFPPAQTAQLAGDPDPDADPDDVPPGLAARKPDDPGAIPPDAGDPGRAALGGDR